MTSIIPLIPIGLVLSLLAGISAFLIAYQEWSHHFVSKREPLRQATQVGLLAFLVFAVATLAAGFLIMELGKP